MELTKPKNIANDAFKSAKWDELIAGRNFAPPDIPALGLLCQWYAVIERCVSDIDFGDALPQVAYSNDIGDLKAMPQLSIMKQASAEIRALNKQLGIKDEHEQKPTKANITKLEVIQSRRNNKASKAM